MIEHCVHWSGSTFLYRGISAVADFRRFPWVNVTVGKRMAVNSVYWHQPLTNAVKKTSKHALRQTAYSLFPHPIPEPFMLSTQWKSKHARMIFPCKCEIHTGKRKICSGRFTICPKKTTLCKVPVPPARQPPAFQLRCQQYINLTNTEGCDLLIWAEPSLTSKVWSVRDDDRNSNP